MNLTQKNYKNKILFNLILPGLITTYIINRNKKITNFLNKKIIFNICGWNISHIFFHYIICVLLRIDSKSELINIIIFDIYWFLFEYLSYIIIHHKKSKKNKKNKSKNQVYKNVYKPRLDDFVFNFLGIYLYTKIHNKIIFNN